MNQYDYDPGSYGSGDRDPYHQNPYQQPRRYKEPGSSGMAMASLVLGFASFFLMMSGMSPLLGGLGILLALLSRGSGKLSMTGIIGLIASACGLVIGTGVMIFLVIATMNSSMLEQYNNLFDYYYYGDDHGNGSDSVDDYNDFFDQFDDGGNYIDDYGDYFAPGGEWYDDTPNVSPDNGTMI